MRAHARVCACVLFLLLFAFLLINLVLTAFNERWNFQVCATTAAWTVWSSVWEGGRELFGVEGELGGEG